MARSWKNKVRRANDRAFDQSLKAEEQDRREMQRRASQANLKLKCPARYGEFLFADLNEEEMDEVLKALVSLGVEYQITS